MSDLPVSRYYDEQYYGCNHKIGMIKLPFREQDYYGMPLRLLGCRTGERLLDVACGNGALLERAESMELECWGIDISQVATDRARERCKAEIVCVDINNGLPYDDQFFDYVTCLGSLEHFERQSFVLSEFRRVTKPSGRIYILVPNDDYILHKLGYETDCQPVINRYSLVGYRSLFERSGLSTYRTLRDNSHLTNLSESSSLPKLLAKLVLLPFVWLIPFRLSYNFIFLCRPGRLACS